MKQEQLVGFDRGLGREPVVVLVFAVCTALLLSLLFVHASVAQEQGQRTFRSAEDAGTALFAASQNEDEKALIDILGPGGRQVISSGDPAEDMDERVGFVVKYQEMHRYVKEADGDTVLYVGAENWPFPIPLVNKNGAWYFDTDAGKEEIVMRRIGKNELSAIDACSQLVDAEKQYKAKAPGGSAQQYALRFVSDRGRHNGLFWSETGDEFDSLIDPLIASAGQENEKTDDGYHDYPMPFHGYFFRILSAQGKHALGGAKNYMINGKMDGGFAFVAYPAEYRSSGVTSFIVDQSGVVYEKDLGPNTGKIATDMTDYDPDPTWQKVE